MRVFADLRLAIDKEEVIKVIQRSLGIRESPLPSWDGLQDDVAHFPSASAVWIKEMNENPSADKLHLIIINARDFHKTFPKEYVLLEEVLTERIRNGGRFDNVRFSFEIHDGGIEAVAE